MPRRIRSLGYLLIIFLTLDVASDQCGCTSQSRASIVGSSRDGPIYLESMEDLEHVAYLSLRNFNMTDEGLLQSSWLMGLSNAIVHKQHQKDVSSALSEAGGDSRDKLALMLESFILNLRNGHSRRIQLDELQSIVRIIEGEQSGAPVDNKPETVDARPKTAAFKASEPTDRVKKPAQEQETSMDGQQMDEPTRRCNYLVRIYQHELQQRRRIYLDQPESRIDFDQGATGLIAPEISPSQPPAAPLTSKPPNSSDRSEAAATTSIEQQSQQAVEPFLDTAKLSRLCKLVVECQSADEFVRVISGSWRSHESPMARNVGRQQQQPMAARSSPRRRSAGEVEQDANFGNDYTARDGPLDDEARMNQRLPPKGLRDSLSLSLAKLCPLILFQLHEEDGLCMVRRDDRPPMITVWGFATLFVTIVCFCSLIGLSITPLLGPAATESSETSDPSGDRDSASPNYYGADSGASMDFKPIGFNQNRQQNNRHHNHRASLTLFEGLAVGSLVGSALFSLIPQAFELQERESNQGFLLKAFIIFAGIYLFFLSERLMRIILDTRQLHKKRKRLNHRSSNSIQLQLASATGPGDLRGNYEGDQQAKLGSFLASGRTQVIGPSNKLVSHDLGAPVKDKHSRKDPTAIKASKRARRRKTRQQVLAAKRRKQMRYQQQHQHCHHSNHAVEHRRQSLTSPSSSTSSEPESTASSSSTSLSSSSSSLPATNRWGQQMLRCASDEDEDQFGDYDLGNSSGSEGANEFAALDMDTDDEQELQQVRAVSKQMSELTAKRMGTGQRQPDWSPRRLPAAASSSQSNPQRHSRRTYLQNPRRSRGHQNSTSYQLAPMSDEKFAAPAASPPVEQDISTVAWMIVLGDGLHNFIDGISIGAAFSESILSGVSISVAVICEEFPHELGDFAVLVSSGMTVRQALGYNFLSACTCYLGMAVGIILGDVNDGASYISALAAGVFLYIALVDMMGELSATLEDTSRNSIAKTLKLLLLQNIGIFIGISIIFVLSFIDF